MDRRILLFCFLLYALVAESQCLTDLRKILPDRVPGGTLEWAHVAMAADVMVVSSEVDDSLGYDNSGAAYLFQKSPAGWTYIAMLRPSQPSRLLQFGAQIAIDSLGETIAFSCNGLANGGLSQFVYVFQKPASGWTTSSETDRVPLPFQGPSYNLVSVALHADGLALAVGQEYDGDGTGGAWIIERHAKSESFSSYSPVRLVRPPLVQNFGTSIAYGNKSFAILGRNADWRLHITMYSKKDGLSYSQDALLTTSGYFQSSSTMLNMRGNTVAVPGINDEDLKNPFIGGYIFQRKAGKLWKDTTESGLIHLGDSTMLFAPQPVMQILDDDNVAATGQYSTLLPGNARKSSGYIDLYTRGLNSWSDATRTRLLEEPLPANGYFINYGTSIAFNGSQLANVPTPDADNTNYLNSVTSMTRLSNSWVSKIKVKMPYHRAVSQEFGTAVIRQGDDLIVGIPEEDGVFHRAGAVNVYRKIGDDWKPISKLLPPARAVTDRGFGIAVSATDSLILVGAPYYGLDSGKVFLYQRTGPDWSTYQLSQEFKVPEGQDLYYFGHAVGVGKNVVAVTAFNRAGGGGTSNALAIFSRTGSSWHFDQVIDFGNSWLHESVMQVTVRNDSIYVYSGYGGYALSGTGVVIVTKANGQWSPVTSFELPQWITAAYLQISIASDHVFVGAPLSMVDGVTGAGTVIVYSKSAGAPWPAGTIPPSAEIFAKDKTPYNYFGASISQIANTLVVGAPGPYYEPLTGQQREVPGSTYIITARDYYWKEYDQLLKLQGTASNRKDGFGYSVAVDSDSYFIGAPFESNEIGSNSGAVYTIPTPPLIKLIEPVCADATRQLLFGYPYGGVWSGPGVSGTGSNAQFDPVSVGPGKYLLTYKTPNCEYEGKLLMVVKAPPIAQLLTPANISICPAFPETIRLQPMDSATYTWYFKPLNGGNQVVVAGQTGPDLVVGLSGYYFCEIRKGLCPGQSPVVTVTYETPAASIGPQATVCQTSTAVSLVASPAGGSWTGYGVDVLGMFQPAGLVNGHYPVVYTFHSSSGCQYALRDTVFLDAIPSTSISVSDKDYCVTGLITLTASKSKTGWSYSWKYHADNSAVWTIVDAISEPVRTFVSAGFYQVAISDGFCLGESSPIQVGLDKSIAIHVGPAAPAVTICKELSFELSASGPPNTEFHWVRSDQPGGPYAPAGDESVLDVKESGYYKVTAELGICSSESAEKEIYFMPADSIWVPNVFSPNDDAFNQRFELKGNVQPELSLVVNRWGEEVYRSRVLSWDGGNESPGVYFWSVFYLDCKQEEKKIKGYVQLVR